MEEWKLLELDPLILLRFTHSKFLLKFAGFLQGETLRMTTTQEFREFGVAMVNYIADYLDNIRERPVVPKASPIFRCDSIS